MIKIGLSITLLEQFFFNRIKIQEKLHLGIQRNVKN